MNKEYCTFHGQKCCTFACHLQLPEIVESEAEVVQLIFRLFLYGKAPSAIAAYLTGEGIKTPGGKTVWRSKTVESILTNEKYKGDARLQKKFTVDFLTKKVKVNEGEVPQYYVENSHPAIIAPEIFDLVQYEWKRQKCDGLYGSKIWDSNTEYRRLVWQCNKKYRGGHCHTPHLEATEVRAAFLTAFNAILNDRTEILDAYGEVIEALTNTSDLDIERGELQNEADVVMELMKKAISENAHKAQDQEEYQRKYEGYCARFEKARNRLAEIEDICLERTAKKIKIQMFMERLEKYGDLVTEFDEELWYSTMDYVTVFEDKRMVFTFRDGTEVAVKRGAWEAA